jgi:hypothetical protein
VFDATSTFGPSADPIAAAHAFPPAEIKLLQSGNPFSGAAAGFAPGNFGGGESVFIVLPSDETWSIFPDGKANAVSDFRICKRRETRIFDKHPAPDFAKACDVRIARIVE